MQLVDIWLLIISSSLGLFLSAYVARNRRAPGSQALSILILGASVWSLSFALEVIAVNQGYKLFWEKFEYFGIVTIPLAWFTFVDQYLGNPVWMKRILRLRIILLIIPVLTLILVWTNDYHHLIWRSVFNEAIGPLETLGFNFGPWFWVLMIYNYTLLILGSIKLAISLFKVVRLQRWQIILSLIAILLPWISNILYIMGISPEYFLDLTAFLFLFSGLFLTISLFRFHLVNILPIAQEAVFAGLADCVLVLDMNDRVVDMNPSAKKMAECPGEMALGKNVSMVMPEILDHIRQAGYKREYVTELSRGEEQEQQYYDLHISLLNNPSTIPIGRVIVLHQITQHKRDEAELVRARDQLEVVVMERTEELRQVVGRLEQELFQRTLAEKRFEDIVESAPDAMFLLNQAGEILLLNAMAEKMFGFPRAQLVGKSFTESLIPMQHRPQQLKYFTQFTNGPAPNRTSFGIDLYAMRSDGWIFPIEEDLSRLELANGFWLAINIHDISERKRAEVALRDSEQTYRALFENAGDIVFLTDVNGQIIQGNQKATQMLGFNQKELQTLSIFDITLVEEHPDVRQKMEKLLKGHHLMPYIRNYLKRSGERLPTENYKVLVNDADGKPKYFQNVARDISERIKAEREQMNLLQEIQQSNEQLRDLAFRLQEIQETERKELAAELHDRVGQNLTALNLNVKIIQNQLLPEFMPEIHKRLSESLLLVEETTHKIRDVMADLDPPVLDEYGLLAAIKWYSADFTNRTGIVTHVHGGKIEPRLLPSVEKILFRLVQESLNNVVKHAQASQVAIGVKSTKADISVSVKDNGKGFDPRDIQEPKIQPHWGFLSMEQRAASIGAQLIIDSTPGRGTQVFVKVGRNHHGD